jgi:hypothetical protein
VRVDISLGYKSGLSQGFSRNGFPALLSSVASFHQWSIYNRMAKKTFSDCSEAPITNYKGAGLLLLI